MKIRIVMMFIAVLCAATFVYANGFRSSEEAYAYGFRAGYSHGITDYNAHLSFNFRSVSSGIRYDTFRDAEFQRGFENGYSDGFYRQQQGSVQIVYHNEYDPQSFQVGYGEGYRQGLNDRDSRLDFNVRYNDRSGQTYSATFQSGYLQGYRQGYYGASIDVTGYPETTVISANPGLVVAYKDDDFDGKMREFPVGNYAKLHDGWNDSIDSIQIVGNVRVILFEKDNFEGKRLIVERSTKDLEDFNFGDKTGSMIIEQLN